MAQPAPKFTAPPKPALPVPWNYAFVLISGVVFWIAGWPLGNCVLVIVLYGPRAFFVDGLRVANSHRGLLSNGQQVNQNLNFGIFLAMFLFVACVVFNALVALRRRFARRQSIASR